MTNTRPLPQRALRTVLVALAGWAAFGAQALPTINLTGASYNGVAVTTQDNVANKITNVQGSVIFTNQAYQPTGTGVFNPFLRLDVKGNQADEQGYNTSATISEGPSNNQTTRKVLDNMSPVNWTHDVLISDLALTADGKYYQFKLDINEPGNALSLLSLDGLKLFSTSLPSQSTETLNNMGDLADNALANSTLLWNMDYGLTKNQVGTTPPDNSVLLDAKLDKGPGSGVSDMVMLVERAVIDNRANKDQNYLVLWSRFGLEQSANTGLTTADAGFEEWAYSSKSGTCTNCGPGGGGGVPVPGTVLLAALGLALIPARRRAPAVHAAI